MRAPTSLGHADEALGAALCDRFLSVGLQTEDRGA